jgi:hypothetical protein
MAHHPSPAPVVPPSRVTPLDLICVALLGGLLWWGASQIQALTHRGVPTGTPTHDAPVGAPAPGH